MYENSDMYILYCIYLLMHIYVSDVYACVGVCAWPICPNIKAFLFLMNMLHVKALVRLMSWSSISRSPLPHLPRPN